MTDQVKAFIRHPGGEKVYLPGDLTDNGLDHHGGCDVPTAKIPQQDGLEVVDAQVSRSAERIVVSGKLRRAEQSSAAVELATLNTLLQNLKARGSHDSLQLEFGWENLTTAGEYFNTLCYVEDWRIHRRTYLPGQPWLETEWTLTVLVPDPALWTDTVTPPDVPDDTIVLQADRIILAAGESVLIKTSGGDVQLQVDVATGTLSITGDYGFLT